MRPCFCSTHRCPGPSAVSRTCPRFTALEPMLRAARTKAGGFLLPLPHVPRRPRSSAAIKESRPVAFADPAHFSQCLARTADAAIDGQRMATPFVSSNTSNSSASGTRLSPVSRRTTRAPPRHLSGPQKNLGPTQTRHNAVIAPNRQMSICNCRMEKVSVLTCTSAPSHRAISLCSASRSLESTYVIG